MGYYAKFASILLHLLILQTRLSVNASYDYDDANVSSGDYKMVEPDYFDIALDDIPRAPFNNYKGKLFKIIKLAPMDTDRREFSIDTSGCRVRNVDEFDEESLPHLNNLPPFECHDSRDVAFGLVYRDGNSILINVTVRTAVVSFYNITNTSDCYCCTDYLKRYSNEDSDEIYRISTPCTPFYDKMDIRDEYMSITCYVRSGQLTVYRNYEFAVLPKSDVEARCHAHTQMERARGTPCTDRLSVLLLGIDSVSRAGSRRFLQRTRLQLQQMEAIEFAGYNRVATSTFANIGLAMLMGQNYEEMNSQCMPPDQPNGRMDRCLTLFDHFGAAGYRTAMVENMNYFALFSYTNEGLLRQPADYYGRTFYNAMLAQNNDREPDCYRSGTRVSNDEAVFQWAAEFQEAFANRPHFGHFWISTFSHSYDGINEMQHVDDFLPQLLQRLSPAGRDLLNTTLLVFMSDHGYTLGGFSETTMGTLEKNMPFLFLVFPPWFRNKYKHAMTHLRENANKRLTTHYDMHATLRDIANCRFSGEDGEMLLQFTSNKYQSPRGISLFDPVPESRTCNDAGIPKEYCSCDGSTPST